jgi:hypothetical protein
MRENIKEVVEKWKAKVSLVEKLEKMSGRKHKQRKLSLKVSREIVCYMSNSALLFNYPKIIN